VALGATRQGGKVLADGVGTGQDVLEVVRPVRAAHGLRDNRSSGEFKQLDGHARERRVGRSRFRAVAFDVVVLVATEVDADVNEFL
jgi:hypothetical protein